jgi:hypothetical protein
MVILTRKVCRGSIALTENVFGKPPFLPIPTVVTRTLS